MINELPYSIRKKHIILGGLCLGSQNPVDETTGLLYVSLSTCFISVSITMFYFCFDYDFLFLK